MAQKQISNITKTNTTKYEQLTSFTILYANYIYVEGHINALETSKAKKSITSSFKQKQLLIRSLRVKARIYSLLLQRYHLLDSGATVLEPPMKAVHGPR